MAASTATHHYRKRLTRAAVIAVLALAVNLLPQLRTVDGMLYDLWLRILPPAPCHDDLLIVDVDEPSFQILQRPWPWPRALHARLVDTLRRAGARAIVFDIVFADPTTAEDDHALQQALCDANTVVLASTMDIASTSAFTRTIHVQPLQALRDCAVTGLAMITPDADGVVRRFHSTELALPTLPAVATRLAASAEQRPAAGLIAFAGPAGALPHVSYYQVIDAEHPLPADRIAGRIVLVGRVVAASPDPTTATDSFRTPGTAFDGRYMAGVEVHANILNTMLHGPDRQELPRGLHQLLTVLLTAAAALLLDRLQPGALAPSALILGLAPAGVSLGALALAHLWIPPTAMTSGVLLAGGWSLGVGYIAAARQRAWIRDAFGRYISRDVVDMLIDRPDLLQLGGTEVHATVLFLDLEGFTTLSEGLKPDALVSLLAEIFAPLTGIIKAEHGTLDKFIGDAIMAFWGAPIPAPDHAMRACCAALAMRDAMQELARGIKERGGPHIAARIGLHSGPLVVGNIGGQEQFNYTCLGDTVNLASRLESANKTLGSRILISRQTADLLGPAMQLRPLGAIRVKGRREAVDVLELLGKNEHPAREWLDIFECGMSRYLQGDFAAAATQFEEVGRIRPGDGPAAVFLARCRRLQTAPPPEWTGIWSAEHDDPDSTL